jgi:hypothetical protein
MKAKLIYELPEGAEVERIIIANKDKLYILVNHNNSQAIYEITEDGDIKEKLNYVCP